jgi:hypothetical protein
MKTRVLAVTAIITLVSLATLAADVNGAWTGTVHTREGGAFEVTLTLKASGNNVTGTYGQGSQEDVEIENGKLNRDAVTFTITRHSGERTIKVNYTGKVEGDTMKLNAQVEGSPRALPETTLTRKK